MSSLEVICIFLAGFAGVFVVRVIVKFAGVLIIKFFTKIYLSLSKMLNKHTKQKEKK